MAKQPGLDFQSAKGGLGELKRRLLIVVGALIAVYYTHLDVYKRQVTTKAYKIP